MSRREKLRVNVADQHRMAVAMGLAMTGDFLDWLYVRSPLRARYHAISQWCHAKDRGDDDLAAELELEIEELVERGL